VKNNFFFICLVFFFLSCEEEIVYEFASTQISSADFELCVLDHCPDVSLNYVEFNSPETISTVINKDIEAFLIDHLIVQGQSASSIKEAIELYLSNSQNAYPEDSGIFTAHELEIAVEVSYTSNEILTLQNDYYQFAGGAHGVSAIQYWNYNPKTGQKFTNNALFNDLDGFVAFAKAKFIKTHGSLDQFWFEDGVFTLPANMGFGETGFVLFYNVYEIAPYADGTFQLEFTWDEIEGYLSF